jgi:outer membrane protein OmpA-like peptidoglycan-associated protein
MNENPITIELGSHTDCRGSDAYNETLSQRRAESAVSYIVSHGINPSRITAKGYGEYQPVVKCLGCLNCTEAEHQLNRRTEFKVVSSYADHTADTFNSNRFHAGETIDVKVLPENFFDGCK